MKTRLASSLLLTTVALAACTSSGASAVGGGSSPAASPASSGIAGSGAFQAQQVSEANGVTVAATWGGPTAGGAFDVALDTHSGSLDDIDLAAAILRNDRGEKLVGASWRAPAGGHHRAGRLTFSGDAASIVKGAAWVELVLPNVGGVPERVLRWTVGE